LAALALPRSTVFDRLASKLSRASVAAVSAFIADDARVRPGPMAIARERGLLRRAPSVTQVVAQPIAIATPAPSIAPPAERPRDARDVTAWFPGSLVISPEFARVIPDVLGIRVGDLVTRINERPALDPSLRPPCRGGDGFWVEGFRRGYPYANYVRCDAWRDQFRDRRNVARSPRALLGDGRWRADLPQAHARARSTASRPLARGPWRPSFERDGRARVNASR
jgi:hypothetical protein